MLPRPPSHRTLGSASQRAREHHFLGLLGQLLSLHDQKFLPQPVHMSWDNGRVREQVPVFSHTLISNGRSLQKSESKFLSESGFTYHTNYI